MKPLQLVDRQVVKMIEIDHIVSPVILRANLVEVDRVRNEVTSLEDDDDRQVLAARRVLIIRLVGLHPPTEVSIDR